MNNKTFATLMLIIGLFLLIAGAGIVISSMNQTINSPFMTSASSVNSMWNTETAGIILAVIGSLLILMGIWIIF